MGGCPVGYLQSGAEELNSGLPRANPASGRMEDLNQGPPNTGKFSELNFKSVMYACEAFSKERLRGLASNFQTVWLYWDIKKTSIAYLLFNLQEFLHSERRRKSIYVFTCESYSEDQQTKVHHGIYTYGNILHKIIIINLFYLAFFFSGSYV